MSTHAERVDRQFSEAAQRYLGSDVHAKGKDLDWLSGIVERHRPRRVLDLGAGAGHVSYRVAPHVQSVTALDPSREMLSVVERESLSRGIPNIETRTGVSTAIPFGDGTFDCIVSRYSAHHWSDLQTALAECFRVLVPGGRILMMDSSSPRETLLDTWLQTIELLRDTTHVRSHSLSEWEGMLDRAGFEVVSLQAGKVVLPFLSWVQRSGTTEERSRMIRQLFDLAPEEVREYYLKNGGNDLVIEIDTLMIEAVSRQGDEPAVQGRVR